MHRRRPSTSRTRHRASPPEAPCSPRSDATSRSRSRRRCPPTPPLPPARPEPLEPELLAEESGGWTALPSAVAFASVSAEVETVNRPPFVLTVIAPTSVAREVVFARLMATAAATDTPPEEVSDFGVLSPPSDAPGVPRESFRFVFPYVRW